MFNMLCNLALHLAANNRKWWIRYQGVYFIMRRTELSSPEPGHLFQDIIKHPGSFHHLCLLSLVRDFVLSSWSQRAWQTMCFILGRREKGRGGRGERCSWKPIGILCSYFVGQICNTCSPSCKAVWKDQHVTLLGCPEDFRLVSPHHCMSRFLE